MKRRLTVLAVLLCLCLPAWTGAEVPAAPTGPAGTYVFDYANLLSDTDIQAMDEAADAMNGEIGAMAVCVTVTSLDGQDAKGYVFDLCSIVGALAIRTEMTAYYCFLPKAIEPLKSRQARAWKSY